MTSPNHASLETSQNRLRYRSPEGIDIEEMHPEYISASGLLVKYASLIKRARRKKIKIVYSLKLKSQIASLMHAYESDYDKYCECYKSLQSVLIKQLEHSGNEHNENQIKTLQEEMRQLKSEHSPLNQMAALSALVGEMEGAVKTSVYTLHA